MTPKTRRKSSSRTTRRPPKKRYGPVEIFLAVLGGLILVLIGGLVITSIL